MRGATCGTRYNFQTLNFSYNQAEIAELVSEFTDPEVREAVELAALPEVLKQATYFIDVGANVGQYMFHAAKHLQNARLVAIEANPFLIPVLERTIENLRANGSPGNEYEIRAAAVSDMPGQLEFYVSTFPTLSSVFPREKTEKLSVSTVRLDEFYRPAVRAVIKIDVEGAEYRAIRSGLRFLKSDHTSFFVELHSWGDKTIGKYPIHLCWLFFRNGYAVRKIGTHYFFYRRPWMKRSASFLATLPYVAAKHLVCRYGGPIRPWLQKRMQGK